MPFGLTNAPSTFQDLINTIFKEYLRKFILVFFDDIQIYSPDFSSHMGHLKAALEVIRQNKLVVNKKKCLFAKAQLEYLGHIISAKGVQADPAKIESMTRWPVPKDLKSLGGFLGLTGYY